MIILPAKQSMQPFTNFKGTATALNSSAHNFFNLGELQHTCYHHAFCFYCHLPLAPHRHAISN